MENFKLNIVPELVPGNNFTKISVLSDTEINLTHKIISFFLNVAPQDTE